MKAINFSWTTQAQCFTPEDEQTGGDMAAAVITAIGCCAITALGIIIKKIRRQQLQAERQVTPNHILITRGANFFERRVLAFASQGSQEEFAPLEANDFIPGPIMDQEPANETLITEGANFIQTDVLASATEKTIEFFTSMNPNMFSFIATKAAYIYAFGPKKTEQLPNFFKPETKTLILQLRRIPLNGAQEIELARLMENPESYESQLQEESTLSIFNSLRGAGAQEVFQGGLFITQCFQRAIQNLEIPTFF